MDIQEIVNNRWVQAGAIGVASFAAGTGVGYILAKKRAQIAIDEILSIVDDVMAEEEIETDEVEYEMEDVTVPEEITIPDTLVEDIRKESDLSEIVETTIELIDEEIEEIESVFDGNTEDWNYEDELAKRTPDAPYIIHQDEYLHDELGYTQTTLTYYSGDDILTDEQDAPVYNHGDVVGELIFGHGSNDRNVVYVRNQKLEAEYEILLFDGSFELEVLGFNAEDGRDSLEHSLTRFRDSD